MISTNCLSMGFISIADAIAQPHSPVKQNAAKKILLNWQLLCDHLERLLNIRLKLALFRTATSAQNDPLSDETSRSPYSLHMYGSTILLNPNTRFGLCFCTRSCTRSYAPYQASVPAPVPVPVPPPTTTKAGPAPHYANIRDKA